MSVEPLGIQHPELFASGFVSGSFELAVKQLDGFRRFLNHENVATPSATSHGANSEFGEVYFPPSCHGKWRSGRDAVAKRDPCEIVAFAPVATIIGNDEYAQTTGDVFDADCGQIPRGCFDGELLQAQLLAVVVDDRVISETEIVADVMEVPGVHKPTIQHHVHSLS